MSHGSVAAKVRAQKEAHPERYCLARNCLYRTDDDYCPKHSYAPSNDMKRVRFADLEQELARIESARRKPEVIQ